MTPVRQQYLRIKKRFPGALVLFRLGDFYESFDDDARIVSEVCNIVLTARDMGGAERVPLAGVPHHAVEAYLGKLIAAGYKVAIVDQTSDEPVKGLFTREVTRVAQVLPCQRSPATRIGRPSLSGYLWSRAGFSVSSPNSIRPQRCAA
jgi:DNA mismatch repair protein MutS